MSMAQTIPYGFSEPPNNVEAEAALLGAILINNDAYGMVAHIVRADDFFEPVHKRIFAHVAALITARNLADHITLQHAFAHDESLKELDGAKYLGGLVHAAQTLLEVEDYARVIKDLSLKRKIAATAAQATALANDPSATETAPQMLAKLFDQVNALASYGDQGQAIASIDVVAALELARPQRQWLVDQWLPRRRLTLLAGDGGSGKSLIAQQLATSIASGVSWLGLSVSQGPVSMFATEDDEDEIILRHQDICRDLGADAGMIQGNLKLIPRVGMENRLVEFDGDIGRMTATWHGLCHHLEVFKPELVILDNASQMFAGNENSRPQVTWFCNRLEHLCQVYNTTVLLLGHTPKTGAEFSGSTAWNASVRSRMALKPHEERDDVRVLRRGKSNYAKTGDEIELQWSAGVLIPYCVDNSINQEELSRARQTFKDAIDKLTERDINVSHLKTSPRNYAPKVIREHGLAGEHSLRALEAAMWSLIDEGHVLTSQPFGRTAHGNKRSGLKRFFAYEQ